MGYRPSLIPMYTKINICIITVYARTMYVLQIPPVLLFYCILYVPARKMYMHSSGIVHVHVYEQFDFTIYM